MQIPLHGDQNLLKRRYPKKSYIYCTYRHCQTKQTILPVFWAWLIHLTCDASLWRILPHDGGFVLDGKEQHGREAHATVLFLELKARKLAIAR